MKMLRQLLPLLCLVVAGACATTGSRAAPAVEASASNDWSLTGWRLIACCCPSPCPCRLDKKPQYCHGCDHTDVVHVREGSLGGVKMDGVQWAVVGRGFGEQKEGNWAVVYVDETASDQQVKALGDWLSGGVAGLGSRAPYLVGNFLGIKEVPLTTHVSGDKREYGAAIPGILVVETRAIVNPGHLEPVVSTGIMDAFGDRFVHADAVRHEYHDTTLGYAWDLTGRQSNQAEFTLDAANAANFGWGCWSAHADFGDTAPYGEQYGHDHAGMH